MFNTIYNLVIFGADNIKNCSGGNCQTNFPQVQATRDQITTAMTIVFGVIGAIAVIYMLLAGLKFITSQGDPQGTAQARQSIIYGAIGLAVAVSAEAVIHLVLRRI